MYILLQQIQIPSFPLFCWKDTPQEIEDLVKKTFNSKQHLICKVSKFCFLV